MTTVQLIQIMGLIFTVFSGACVYIAVWFIRSEARKYEAWKESAMRELGGWEMVWRAAGEPEFLGSSKAEAVLKWIRSREDH